MRRLVLALALALLAGCGWHSGLEAPGGARSIGVEVFDVPRGILVRDLEPRMNDAVTKALVDLVDVPLASPSSADLVVRGQITEYQRRGGVRDAENQLRESGVYIAASAWLVDRRTGRQTTETATAAVWSGFVIDPQFSFENEGEARDRALGNLARTLVLELMTTGSEPQEAPENAARTGDHAPESASGPSHPIE